MVCGRGSHFILFHVDTQLSAPFVERSIISLLNSLGTLVKNQLLAGHSGSPVIPALWEAEVGDHLKPGVRDQPGKHDETLSLPKIQKLDGHAGAYK